jgi:hypothetical protein
MKKETTKPAQKATPPPPDIDQLGIESDIEAQAVANRNETDRVLISKIETCADLIESANLDGVDLGFVRRKLIELVGRL